MPAKIRALIIEPDPEIVRSVDILGRQTGALDLRWRASTIGEGADLIRDHRPDLAIVGLNGDPAAAIGRLSAEFPGLYILALSETGEAGYVLEAMRAGAHDLIRKPVKEMELRIAAEKAARVRSSAARADRNGEIITVFSNKGGNGATTIAANLAHALVRYHGKKVVVADLVLAHGDMTMFFNVNPSYSITDLAANAEKADHDLLQSLLVRHHTGVDILADTPRIEEAERISADQIRSTLTALRSMFDAVIVDTPHTFDEKTLTALEMSDTILLVTLLNLPALRNTQRSIELFNRLGIMDGRVKLVLSRYLPNDEIPKESIEGIMNCPLFFAIPNDYPAVLSSINRGKLLAEVAPDNEVTQAFRRMAELLAGKEIRQEAPKRKPGLFERVLRPARSAT
jgi:pilus assembly protein CpaE